MLFTRLSKYIVAIACCFIMTSFASIAGASGSVDLCAKTCENNADCGSWGQCANKVCQYKASFCANERWVANERGETSDCGTYACDTNTGTCLRSASLPTDCSPGYVYDGKNSCIKSVDCNPADASCRVLQEKWQKARDKWEELNPQPEVKPLTCIVCDESNPCGQNQMCWNNRCMPQAAYCSQNSSGLDISILPLVAEPRECNEYRCDKIDGRCFSDCVADRDCQKGYACGSQQRCVKSW